MANYTPPTLESYLAALDNLTSAFFRLVEQWDDPIFDTVEEASAKSGYPFQESLDELAHRVMHFQQAMHQHLDPQAKQGAKTAMTRRDFVLIADVLKELPENQRRALAEKFADKLGQTNPAFDRNKFVQYCMGTAGPSGGRVKTPKVPQGAEGQDRDSYSDTQDRKSYTTEPSAKKQPRRGRL